LLVCTRWYALLDGDLSPTLRWALLERLLLFGTRLHRLVLRGHRPLLRGHWLLLRGLGSHPFSRLGDPRGLVGSRVGAGLRQALLLLRRSGVMVTRVLRM
jgi:hypothetical protein